MNPIDVLILLTGIALGFAIPHLSSKRLLRQLVQKRKIKIEGKAYLLIEPGEISAYQPPPTPPNLEPAKQPPRDPRVQELENVAYARVREMDVALGHVLQNAEEEIVQQYRETEEENEQRYRDAEEENERRYRDAEEENERSYHEAEEENERRYHEAEEENERRYHEAGEENEKKSSELIALQAQEASRILQELEEKKAALTGDKP